MNANPQPQTSNAATRAFTIAWAVSLIFYFVEYAVRSSPAVMMPELEKAFSVPALGVSHILGTYYYTYSTTSLVAGLLLDRLGAKYTIPAGAAIMGVGCILFSVPTAVMGDAGRLLQGAGSAFAFTGAVYLATHGFSKTSLATAIGITQCVGMVGGTVGQIGVGPLVHGGMSVATFWMSLGVAALVVGAVLLLLTPGGADASPPDARDRGMLAPYKVVFTNPQSYLCGLVAGLLFVPTTVGDMVWGVRFFQEDRLFTYNDAVLAVSMVPLGWVIGCPLLGFVADKLGRRKPALMGGAFVMLVGMLQLAFQPSLLPAWLTLLLLGIASGSAMIPYTIIKEVNPDEVKGSAVGGINFLTFTVTALVGPFFAGRFASSLGGAVAQPDVHFRGAGVFWAMVIVAALVASAFLRETGQKASRTVRVRKSVRHVPGQA